MTPVNSVPDTVAQATETPVAPSAASAITRLSHASLQERVYQEMRTALRSGRFASGEMLTIRGLAELLGTSAMPVREAVRRLVQDNSLEILPNRSMRVPLMSLRRFQELTEVRATLEGRAAFLAASEMTDATFASIRAANDLMSVAIDRRDVPGILNANQTFHFTIYQAAQSDLLLSTIDMLWQQSGPYLALLMQALKVTTDSLSTVGFGNHFAILAAFNSRNPEAAQAAMEGDIREAADWYIRNTAFNDNADSISRPQAQDAS